MVLFRKTLKIIYLPLKEKFLIIEAYFFLFYYSFLIHFIPFRWWECKVGRKMQPLNNRELTYYQRDQIKKLKRSLIRANKLFFYFGKCFAMSLSLKKMMERRGIRSTLFIGIRKDEIGNLKIHAWLNFGNISIYGGKEAAQNHKELLTYT